VEVALRKKQQLEFDQQFKLQQEEKA